MWALLLTNVTRRIHEWASRQLEDRDIITIIKGAW